MHADARQVPIPIAKADDALQVVWGWASVVEENGRPIIDLQGDVIEPGELMKALDPVKGNNTLIHITVDGKSIPVMVKDVQRDALRGQTTHVDFIRVRTDQPVRITVPIVITGKAEGLKVGGTLHQVYRKLQIQCTPDKIPARIEIDVTALGLGQAIHVSDLKLGAGVQAVLIDTAAQPQAVAQPLPLAA